MLDLKPRQKVLDVGCGIGGGDFYMAENFGVDVVGIDLSVNMISLALERAVGLKCSVEFEMLRDAGFREVIAENRTEQFKEVLTRELERFEKGKQEFINDFTEDDYNDIVSGWKAKLVRTGSGEQRWGLFFAKKK